MSGDLAAKYQKLAQEYGKLKAQVAVLKKAVIDEQGKNQALEEVVKDRDQLNRKCRQELDSLTFRNQQLSKRVTILQEELETPKKGKKSKTSVPSGPSASAAAQVQAEELQTKIAENERLHIQVFEANQEKRVEVERLKNQLSTFQKEAEQHQSTIELMRQQKEAEVHKLLEDKTVKEVRLQQLEQELGLTKERAELSEQQLASTKKILENETLTTTRILAEKLPFNDTALQEWNMFNVPTYDRKQQMKAQELVAQAGRLIHELVTGMSNFVTYLEQRANTYPVDATSGEPLSPVNLRLCSHLKTQSSWVRPMDKVFSNFKSTLRDDIPVTLETCAGLQEFSVSYHEFVVNLQKAQSYLVISLDMESQVSWCPPTLERHNTTLCHHLRLSVAAFTRLDTYLQLLAAQTTHNCKQPASNRTAIFKQLAAALLMLHKRVKEMSSFFSAKVTQEHMLPTATQKLKTTNECVLSSLASVTASSEKIASFVESNLEYITLQAGLHARGAAVDVNSANTERGRGAVAAVTVLRRHAAKYMLSLQRSPPESVPYAAALLNNHSMISSTESRDSLAQQVAEAQQRISKLEQEKEHWMLEAQLLQIKFEKEQKKISVLTSELQLLQHNGPTTPPPAVSSATPQTEQSIPSSPAVVRKSLAKAGAELGLVTAGDALETTEEDTRADLIKKHFTARVAELTTQLQECESKAVHFQAECRSAHRRLAMAERARERASAELDAASQQIQKLQDDVSTTSARYETQLSMMSDHLCGLNEKLTSQRDEIEALKSRGKKGKR